MFPFPVAPIASSDVFGQWERTAAGSTTFVVPAGVYSICAVVVGASGASRSVSPFEGSATGGLHWRNDIPVTPGESLSITVGAGGVYGGNPQGGESAIARGGTYLLRAGGGSLETNVGLTYAGTLGGGGSNGGVGGTGLGGTDGGLGAGAPGYTGAGGRGESFSTPIAAGATLPTGGAASGGGRGGTTPGGANAASSGWDQRVGEGVGLQGLNGAYGSPIGTQVGAGVFGNNGNAGGVRIMWGGGRTYPSNARDL